MKDVQECLRDRTSKFASAPRVADEKYSGKHVGDVILRIYGEKFVSLNDPISTWDTYVTFSVLPFNKGETFEVVSK